MTHPRALLAVAAVALSAVVFLVLGRGETPRGEAAGLTPATSAALDHAPAPDVDAQERDGARAPKVERSALALEPASSDTTALVKSVLVPGTRLTGTVVDARSLPIAGAEVRLLVPGRPVLAAHSGDDGRFELAAIPPAELPWLVGTLHAVAPDGCAAARVTRVPASAASYTPPPIELVVGAARPTPIIVLVEDEGRPIAGAEVELEAGFERALVGVAQTDVEGRVRFDGVPLGSLHARAAVDASGARRIGDAGRIGEVSAPSAHPDGTPLRIVLGDARDVTVLVRETGTELPRSGVRVYAERTVMPPRTFMRSGDFDAPSERIVAGAVATTDGEGRATLRGLPRELLLVHAEVKSFDMFDGSPRRRVGADDTEVTLEIVRTDVRPRVRWPIVAGDRPVPPSGARIQLRIEPGRALAGAAADWPREGVMVGSELVVEGVPDTHVGLLAATDDGGIARLVAAKDTDLGQEASFRRARTITVRVRDHAGVPLAGYAVGATNQGNNELCEPVRTGADGVAVIDGLHGGLADVWVTAEDRPRTGTKIGSIDLEQGDGSFEFTAPEELRASVRVFVDGARCLPPGLSVRPARVLSRDPLEALVTLTFSLAAEDAARDVWVNAPGHSGVKIPLTRALAAPGAPPVEARLGRAGALLVDVLRAPDT